MNLLEKKINHLKVKLASKSPRRQELLRNIIEDFEIVTKDVEEEYPNDLKANEIVLYLAKLKANSYLKESKENELYITADTIVVYENKVLGKPIDSKDAFRMLKELSGNTHTVYTGVSLLLNGKINSFLDSTEVSFYDLSDEEITFYINHYKPMDKAGAYGIQEWMGYVGVKKMEGDFFNVMGLPLHKLYREIEKIISKKK
jgi:septum formation protein